MTTNQNKVPDNPIAFVQECVISGRIYWTYHVNMRIRERGITRKWILDAVESYEIVESYPDDKYLPSYLIWARIDYNIIHILIAADVEGNNVRIVTAYKPDPVEWDETLKRRRTI